MARWMRYLWEWVWWHIKSNYSEDTLFWEDPPTTAVCQDCLPPDQSYRLYTSVIPDGNYRCPKCGKCWRKLTHGPANNTHMGTM